MAQPKVSMVIPCYNKVESISNMFNSILEQEWDNIELILVNDGSTDGTREIIADFEPKFISRGYEVIIIDQENQGLAAAVRNGLARITGEFVCSVDADDELDFKYVSAMAGWLTDNSDYEWVACDSNLIRNDSVAYRETFPDGNIENCKIENWIFRKIGMSIWVYMIRSEYLRRCNVVASFCINRGGNQEPQIFFPLVSGNGRLKYLQIPLYKYNKFADTDAETARSNIKNYEYAVKYFTGRYETVHQTIESLDIDEKHKKRLHTLTDLRCPIDIIKYALLYQIDSTEYARWKDKLFNTVNLCFGKVEQDIFECARKHLALFSTAIEDNIFKVTPKLIQPRSRRIIAWGALGKNAQVILPLLKDTPLAPTELWDNAGNGEDVHKPCADSLKDDDIVLLLPIASESISASLVSNGFENFMTYTEILTYIAAFIFPEFYDGRVKFIS